MKALFEKLTFTGQSSLLVRQFKMPYFDAPWHYHPEYELTYIVKGYGRRFVGDHVDSFEAGDLVLIGPDLPHFWRSDDEFYQMDSGLESESIVIQFPGEFVQQGLATVPEANGVRQLLERSVHGLHFSPDAAITVIHQLEELPDQSGFRQLLGLLNVLHTLAGDRDGVLLASDGYQLAPGAAETERMKRVLEFMLTNFRDEIRVEQIASVAGMAPAAFCRYFKKRTRKSFVEYLNELRIGHARKLLTDVDMSIGLVGMECGFNTSSHFHRQFRLQTGMTRLHYQTLAKEKFGKSE